MKGHSPYKHLLGAAACTIVMFAVILGAFSMGMITFHNGPASDFHYSKTQIFMADLGGFVFGALVLWPCQQFRLGSAAWLVLPVIYGCLLYGLFIALRRRKAS